MNCESDILSLCASLQQANDEVQTRQLAADHRCPQGVGLARVARGPLSSRNLRVENGPELTMPRWAKTLGDCSDKISREHVLSEGAYPDQMIRVKGLPWCPDEFREISIASFTKKSLCERHNNALSPLDQAYIGAMDAFRGEIQLNHARAPLKPIRWKMVYFDIDGRGLERWCLKTLITIYVNGEYRIGRDSLTVGEPSHRLVKIALGEESFSGRSGLYGLGAVGTSPKIADSFRLIPYVNSDRVLMGGLFGIHGYRFLLHLEEEGAERALTIPDFDSGEGYVTRALFPLRRMNFKVGKHISHSFRFHYD